MSNKLSLLVNFIGHDKITGLMKTIVGLGRDGSKSIKALAGEAKKLENELTSVQKGLAKGVGNVSDLVNRERDLESQLARVNAQLTRQKGLAAINADRMAMRRTADDAKQRGQDKMLSGTAMATPFILASKAAMDFSSGMVDIQQKAELSNAETDRMAINILALAKAAHQLPEDMRMGVDTLAGLGLDPRKAEAMIGPIGKLGTAFKVELADGANAAFANLNNLKVPISDTARALDIMAASGNAGAFEVKDMARWFPSLTAQMQALGQKGTPAVADLAAALQIARRGAGTADEAANNIQNLLSKIQSPETIKKFAKFGVDVPAALKKAAREGKTPLETIAELTQKATKGDTGKIGFLFEDMQAQSALRSLILNMEDFRKMRAEITKGGGTVDRAFAQREARDASIAWRDFMGSVERLGITLGNGFLPAATTFLGATNSMIGAVSAWAQANPRLSSTLMMVLGGAVALRIATGGLLFAFGNLLGPLSAGITIWRQYRLLGSLAAVFPNVAAGMGMVVSVASKLPGLLMGLLTAFRMVGLFMVTTPAGLALTALLLGGAAVYANWDKIKGALGMGKPDAGGGAPMPPADWSKARVSHALTPIKPAAAATRQMVTQSPLTVHVNAAPGQNEDVIAQRVIDRWKQEEAVKARSSYNGGR